MILLALLLAGLHSADSSGDVIVRGASVAYSSCVLATARKYSSTLEAADIVVSAAMTHCGQQRDELKSVWHLSYAVKAADVGPDREANIAEIAITQFDKLLRARAIEQVVDVRASRAVRK